MLDALADMLNLPRSSDTRTQINDIILEVNRRVENKETMDALSANARPIIGMNF